MVDQSLSKRYELTEAQLTKLDEIAEDNSEVKQNLQQYRTLITGLLNGSFSSFPDASFEAKMKPVFNALIKGGRLKKKQVK